MSIILNTNRPGNFSSSNAYKLLSTDRSGKNFGKPALTYIEEKNMERELGISIETEADARPLQWGRLCEEAAFNLIGTNYTLTSDVTLTHPEYDFWVGSKDGHTEDAVMDLKCPITKKSWFKLVAGENIYSMIDGFTRNGAPYSEHSDGEKYYWQLVSNAIISGKKFAELIVFIPYKAELEAIRIEAKFQGINWIAYSTDEEMPFINEGGKFKNITTIRFEVPQKDIDLLTAKMIEASQLLIPRTALQQAA